MKRVRIIRISTTGAYFTDKQQEHFAVGTIHNVTVECCDYIELDCCSELGWRHDEVEFIEEGKDDAKK